MALFSKIGEIARNVSDKTGDMLEISKLNVQIREDQDEIEELKQKLGDYIWKKFDSGIVMDEHTTELCTRIRAAYADIAKHQADIEAIKPPQESSKEQLTRGADARSGRSKSRIPAEDVKSIIKTAKSLQCPMCGAEVGRDSVFCGECGTRIR